MVLLDTCIFPRMVEGVYVPKTGFCISAVTLGEGLRVGSGMDADGNARAVRQFVSEIEREAILPYTHAEAQVFSRFASRITSPKRVADMMIAATALPSGLKLVTSDRRMAALQSAIAAIPDLPPLMVDVVRV